MFMYSSIYLFGFKYLGKCKYAHILDKESGAQTSNLQALQLFPVKAFAGGVRGCLSKLKSRKPHT